MSASSRSPKVCPETVADLLGKASPSGQGSADQGPNIIRETSKVVARTVGSR